jgi:hypothetical protein
MFDGELFAHEDGGLMMMLKESLQEPTRREELFQVMETHGRRPLSHAQIFKLTGRYIDLKKEATKHISDADVSFLNFAVRYLEDWFYEGTWATPSALYDGDTQAYTQYSVPAAIANLVSKFKEDGVLAGRIHGFDHARTEKFVGRVMSFARTQLSIPMLTRMQAMADTTDEERAYAADLIKHHTELMNTLERSSRSVLGALSGHNPASDLYFLKTCLMAGEMVRRDKKEHPGSHFIPSIPRIPRNGNRYETFDFSNGRDPFFNTMHYPTERIPFAILAVWYLQHHTTGDRTE